MEDAASLGSQSLFSQHLNPMTTIAASRMGPRPLSDIKEITETSLFDPSNGKAEDHTGPKRHYSQTGSARPVAVASLMNNQLSQQASTPGRCASIRAKSKRMERSSVYRIPPANVPPRSSSKQRCIQTTSIAREPAVLLPTRRAPFHYIPNLGQSQSPVKDLISRLYPVEHGHAPRIPSKTIVKIDSTSSENILGQPTLQHPRLRVNILVAAPLFVGGSSVEGTVRIVVDEAERIRHKKTLTLERVTIDLLGVEEVSGESLKRHVFLALGNELVDLCHPPPVDMVESQQPLLPQQRSWILTPSVSNLPFLINLPLNVGPPPFQSKHARIRYVLCATLIIKDAGRQLSVRCSQDTAIMSVSDPEKALVSLPSPLTVSETFTVSPSSEDHVVLSAGLHRQVWVSGTNLFVDVHIVNNSSRKVKKLEFRLERIILCYRHAAAATLETSASNARMFDYKEQVTVARIAIKPGIQGWSSVFPGTTVLRTCEMELPRGHATVQCHKFFEVRYYLYITVCATWTGVATVQLPIHIIHMNSLDIPTNSVAQVAAAIEEKRSGRPRTRAIPTKLNLKSSKTSLQGRAFAAPRVQSLDRARAKKEDIENLSQELQKSPSKHDLEVQRIGSSCGFKTPPSNRKGRIINDDDAFELRKHFCRVHRTSFDSILTSRSVARSNNPPHNSSALGQYLQENDLEYRNNNCGSPASANRALQTNPKPKLGHERWKPLWSGPTSRNWAGQDL